MACFVGIDVSQRQVSICVLDEQGKRIWRGKCLTDPAVIIATLQEKVPTGVMTLGSAPYVKPGLEHRFRHTAFFIGANVRSAVQEGRADFMPVFLSEAEIAEKGDALEEHRSGILKELYLPTGATKVRLAAAGSFDLETNYDKLEVWAWRSGACRP